MSGRRPPIRICVGSAGARQARRRWGGVAAVLSVLIVGGLATSAAAQAVERGQHRLAIQAMDTFQAGIGAAIRDEVGHYGDALADLVAAIDIEPDLDNAEFQGLTTQLDDQRLPGASAVSFVVPSTDQQVAATQKLWRARGATGLTLYATGAGADHAFVVFSRTYSGNSPAPGRDLNESGETQEALRIARETRSFTVSRAHILLRDRELPVDRQQMSFTLAMPVFTATGTLRGWVTMGVRGGDFLRQTLQSAAQGGVQVSLVDPVAGSAKPIAAVTRGQLMHGPGLSRSDRLEVGHHVWRLTIRATLRLLSTSDRWASQLTLLAGMAVTVLLGVVVTVLAGARNRAMDQVDRATAELRETNGRLATMAFFDQLTGLANRGLFYDRVGHALNTHLRSGGTFAVFFIDLDGFKQVNDELGHSAGDLVLKEVAARLTDCLRDGDTVARFGGDEFAVIAERLSAPEDVHVTAERIVATVSKPIDLGVIRATVGASVGIALNRPGYTADDIVREADLAMYTAKTTGKSRHVLAGADDSEAEKVL
jgi:diguanylate cyclase (GGDEF)-like protein